MQSCHAHVHAMLCYVACLYQLKQTNIGPVLIAINPFKKIASYYTDARIRGITASHSIVNQPIS
jgi:hypothetical protein